MLTGWRFVTAWLALLIGSYLLVFGGAWVVCRIINMIQEAI